MAKSYADKLKDPRWQKKRLEVLERDGWKCRMCKRNDVTLHVHHVNYEAGREPWDYPGDNFACLCEYCHEVTEQAIRDVRRNIATLASCPSEVHTIVDATRWAALLPDEYEAINTMAADDHLTPMMWLVRGIRSKGFETAKLVYNVKEPSEG